VSAWSMGWVWGPKRVLRDRGSWRGEGGGGAGGCSYICVVRSDVSVLPAVGG
jgi:hypothetical protein